MKPSLIKISFLWIAALIALSVLFSPRPAGVTASPSVLGIAGIDPSSAPNDLDTSIVIHGDGFEDGATAKLGNTPLTGVHWTSAAQLESVVPWGLDAGVYDLSVTNPGGATTTLPGAFTVVAALDSWNSTALFGGKVQSVQYNPLDANTLYAVASAVGLFRSRDGGASWSYIWAGMAEALAIDPLTPTRLYMHNQRSEDEGETWTAMDVAWGWPFPHPTIAGRVYMTSSDDSGGGLWRSNDFGANWSPAMNGLSDTQVSAFAFHPTQPETLYAGTNSGKLFVSTNGGDSWTFASQPLGDIESMAVNPNGSHDVWVADCCFCSPGKTARSAGSDLTAWTTVDSGLGAVSQISFAPPAWGASYSQAVFLSACFKYIGRSLDGGTSWETFRPNQTANDQHITALHPTNLQIYTVSSARDGAYQTTDAGATWGIANQGLSALIPNQLETAPGLAQMAYAFTDNGLYKTATGGESWNLLTAELSNPMAIDPSDPNHLYAASGTSYGWGLAISHDGGLTWPDEVFTPTSDPYADYNAVIVWTLRIKPGQSSAMLASVNLIRFGDPPANAGTIYYSTDSGLTWTRATMGGQAGVGNHIRDLAFDLYDPTTAYAATEENGLYRSTDSGVTWQRVGAGISSLNHGNNLAVEPASPYRVFVATDDGIFRSEDHGLTWSLAPGPLSGPYISQFLFTAETPPVLYAATNLGLYRSADASVTWTRAPGVLGQVPVKSLAGEQNGSRTVVYAGTAGGQVYGAGTTGPDKSSPSASESELIEAGIYRYTSTGAEADALPAWIQVNSSGFDDLKNTNVAVLEPFMGYLYAGTWNDAGLAQSWRSADGLTWSQASPPWAAGNGMVTDMAVFNDRLYVGTYNESGGELWRTNGSAWEQVASHGFGDGTNTGMDQLAEFSGMLYVATSNSEGKPQIWRSPSGDDKSWEKVKDNAGGLMQVFGGFLYAGGSLDGKAALWRTDDGSDWTTIFSNGLGENNTHVASLAEFDGELYIGLRNVSTSGQVWRSANGLDWTPSFKFGLGNPDNARPYGLIASPRHLYIVFTNLVTGAEVWRTEDGVAWKMVGKSGLTDSLNTIVDYFDRGAAFFNHDLYLGTSNSHGGQIVRLDLAKRVFLPLAQKNVKP
jgi:photosystem II stability/assembly factor-like uncharacterized protein